MPTASDSRLVLLPAVDVADGQAVQLVQGRAGSERRFGDPRAAAERWQDAGAEWIHLVDLDAAFGRGSNAEILTELVTHLRVDVELSGGIRDDDSLERALATGCARVNLGTAALEQPDWCAEVIGCYGERIAVEPGRTRQPAGRPRLDPGGRGPDGDPATGWTGPAAPASWSPTSTPTACCPARTPICCAGSAPRPTSRSSPAAGSAPWPTCSRWREMVPLGVEGAIIGTALYVGNFTLEEALQRGRNPVDREHRRMTTAPADTFRRRRTRRPAPRRRRTAGAAARPAGREEDRDHRRHRVHRRAAAVEDPDRAARDPSVGAGPAQGLGQRAGPGRRPAAQADLRRGGRGRRREPGAAGGADRGDRGRPAQRARAAGRSRRRWCTAPATCPSTRRSTRPSPPTWSAPRRCWTGCWRRSRGDGRKPRPRCRTTCTSPPRTPPVGGAAPFPEAPHEHTVDYQVETEAGLRMREQIEAESRTPERLAALRKQAERRAPPGRAT